MSIENLVKRADIKGINSPASGLYWNEWFRGYMMRGECEKIMFKGDTFSLHVFHVGRNWAKRDRVFWVLREKRYFYEMDIDSFSWKGEKDFLLPWDLIDLMKKKVLEDLEMREKLAGAVI